MDPADGLGRLSKGGRNEKNRQESGRRVAMHCDEVGAVVGGATILTVPSPGQVPLMSLQLRQRVVAKTLILLAQA